MTQPLNIVIPGGSGQIGTILARHLAGQGHHVSVLTRHKHAAPWQVIVWNGTNLGDWVGALDGADILINLSGRSVNCRYTEKSRAEIKESRTVSTQLLGRALNQLAHPPRLWMNASTATIYRHALDRPMDEASGEIGGEECDVPSTWRFSIDVATSWEQSFFAANIPNVRKVALRSAMIMSPDRGGVFDQLLRLVKWRLGGAAGSGEQFVSWIHDSDFLRSIDYLIAHEELEGAINLAAPNPIPNREFMQALRRAAGVAAGIPSSRLMLEVGAWLLRTETELILKSRRVIPYRLLQSGFVFQFPDWAGAARDLVLRYRARRSQ
ncbi:MAG: TIGR01777 family oxidoreductase [Acidobacteria bacterium]|nr:TIGR01777 family oxidoreductase [Acidobacteriota bacterium]